MDDIRYKGEMDTLSWFWANQSLLFNAVCSEEKQQIPIL